MHTRLELLNKIPGLQHRYRQGGTLLLFVVIKLVETVCVLKYKYIFIYHNTVVILDLYFSSFLSSFRSFVFETQVILYLHFQRP